MNQDPGHQQDIYNSVLLTLDENTSLSVAEVLVSGLSSQEKDER